MITPHGTCLLLLAAVTVVGLLMPAWLFSAEDGTPKVASIDIRGNKRIEDPAIRGRLTLAVGDPYTPEAIRQQIRTLYETGSFEDVRIETQSVTDGVAVVYAVREQPFITEVVIVGNRHLSDDKLRKKITICS